MISRENHKVKNTTYLTDQQKIFNSVLQELKMKNGSISPAELPSEESHQHGCSKAKKKKIIIAVLIIAIAIIVAGLFYVGFSVKVQTCTTTQCIRSATEIRKYIDPRADPCEDFYRFSCGNFLQSNNLQDNRFRSYSVEDIAREEILEEIRDMLQAPIQDGYPNAFNVAKKFYRACMDEAMIAHEGLRQAKEIFKSIGGWPTLEGHNWKDSTFDWMEAVHKLRELGVNFDVFFRVSVDKDRGVGPTGSSRYVVTIHEISNDLQHLNSEVKSMIFEFMVEMSIKFGANRITAQEDARDVLRLFNELSEISKESRLKNKTEDVYERLNLSELIKKYPDIQWHYYINGLLKSVEPLNYEEEIIIMEPRYIQFMEHFLGTTSKRSLANYISWHSLTFLINYLPEEVTQKAFELLDRINGHMMNFKIPRWRTCVMQSKMHLNSVLSAAYIQRFFPEATRYKILKMIATIKKQFEENVYKVDWLDYSTKELILENLRASREKLADYGDLLTMLEENKVLYGQVKINQTKYLKAVLNLNLVSIYQKQQKLRQYVEDDVFRDVDFVTGLNIKYLQMDNILTLPVGLLSGVYYQNDRPEYMNYGILGSIIAHEMSHIFMKAQHGDLPHGELRSWWSSNSLVNYGEKLQCLSNQYANFRVAELRDKHISPAKTQDEDMADLAGLKISYEAYTNWAHENGAQHLLPGLNYSPNQLFWISSAIPHCSKDTPKGVETYTENYGTSPNKYRVNGPLQNLEEFAFDFGCKKGNRMSPEKKCDVW